MGKSRKKKSQPKTQQNGDGLFGVNAATKESYIDTAKQGGLLLLAAIAAGGAGAAIGKHSLIAGIPVTLIGIHKKNKYLVAAGLGLTLSNGFQKKNNSAETVTQTTQGIEGFDLKQIAESAKNRVGTFFENFKEKLYLPASTQPQGTAGLGEENSSDQVTYFVNPYKEAGEIDMSAIDRVQEQIAEMNKNVNGLAEIEREF